MGLVNSLGVNHRQQQIQSFIQEQMPQQIQQMQETRRERTKEARIIHIHQTGRHSPESKLFISNSIDPNFNV